MSKKINTGAPKFIASRHDNKSRKRDYWYWCLSSLLWRTASQQYHLNNSDTSSSLSFSLFPVLLTIFSLSFFYSTEPFFFSFYIFFCILIFSVYWRFFILFFFYLSLFSSFCYSFYSWFFLCFYYFITYYFPNLLEAFLFWFFG